MTFFVFLKFVANLALPPASLAAGVVVWFLCALVRWRRLGLLVLGLAIAQTVLLSLQPVSDALVRHLEDRARQIVAGAPSCCYEAIVVLGGAVVPAAPPVHMDPDLTEVADRVWLGARLFHAGAAPKIIVSGGSFNEQQGGPATSEAEAMRVFLRALGVPDAAIVSESGSLNTIENIRNVREMVGKGRVAIVTSAFHIPRTAALASRAGLDFAMFGSDWQTGVEQRAPWENWLPTISALAWSNTALRELMALTFDRRGRSLGP